MSVKPGDEVIWNGTSSRWLVRDEIYTVNTIKYLPYGNGDRMLYVSAGPDKGHWHCACWRLHKRKIILDEDLFTL